MWSYYGSKKSIINLYPQPKKDKIIEPFAGAASYAIKYNTKNVLLVDKYKIVADIWKWLIYKATIEDIERLPHYLYPGDNLNDFNFDFEEAKLLMGFIIAKGSERPRTKPTDMAIISRPNTINYTLNKIKKYLPLIKHWDIAHEDYLNLKNENATWFIDPPYQKGGYAYPENKINYTDLSEWCKSRNGQVIVCENTSANWMDFKIMSKMKGTHKRTTEVIWSNYKTNYDAVQQTLQF